MDDPLAVDRLGDSRLPGIERGERGLDRVANRAAGTRVDRSEIVEGGVDGLREVGVAHGFWLRRSD